MEIKYIKFEDKYKKDVIGLLDELQNYIISIDSFKIVKRDEKLSSYNLDKILKKRQDKLAEIFLAIDGNLVIGAVTAHVLERDYSFDLQVKNGRFGEIEKLYVKNEYRGQGIGKKLLEIGENFLKNEMKCDLIEVIVFGDNKKALDLYKKTDYRENEYTLLKKIK